MTKLYLTLFSLIIALVFDGCGYKSSQNELYAFLEMKAIHNENNQMEDLFNKSYDECLDLLGQPDTIIVSPYDYYRPTIIITNGYPEDGCEGVFVDEISILQENIPGFVFLSAIWCFSDDRYAKPYLTISFLPKGNKMVSFYLKNYD